MDFDHHETLTAVAVLGRLGAGKPAEHPSEHPYASAWMTQDRPVWKDLQIDFHYWHVGSEALFRLEGPAGPRWKAWNRSLVDALLGGQEKKGHAAGSWPTASRWSLEVGRVWATAINTLTLQTYYR